MRGIWVFVGLMFIVAAVGCGGSKSFDGEPPIPEDNTYLYGWGTGESKSQQAALDKAHLAAQAYITLQLENRMQVWRSNFTKETGWGEDSQYLQQYVSCEKIVAEKMIRMAKIDWNKTKTYPPAKDKTVWRGEMIVKYPLGTAMEEMAAELKRREHLVTELEATKAWNNFENEIDDFREWKKETGWGN